MKTIETIVNRWFRLLLNNPNIDIIVSGYSENTNINAEKYADEQLMMLCTYLEEMKDKIYLTLEHVYNLGYKSFAITEEDEVLFDNQLNWVDYETLLNEVETFEPERKIRWGMIYFKK